MTTQTHPQEQSLPCYQTHTLQCVPSEDQRKPLCSDSPFWPGCPYPEMDAHWSNHAVLNHLKPPSLFSWTHQDWVTDSLLPHVTLCHSLPFHGHQSPNTKDCDLNVYPKFSHWNIVPPNRSVVFGGVAVKKWGSNDDPRVLAMTRDFSISPHDTLHQLVKQQQGYHLSQSTAFQTLQRCKLMTHSQVPLRLKSL